MTLWRVDRVVLVSLTLLLISTPTVRSALPEENQDQQFTFLPSGLLFQPLSANHQEPRMGLRKQVGSSRMRLDIGNCIDLAEYSLPAGSAFRFGVDFFAYALTTNSQGLRLQVDALDGFIGGHLSFATAQAEPRFAARLRIMHLSAHFVDGHFDNSSGRWKDGREPIPFTKDFGELTGSYTWETKGVMMMGYAGFSYSTLVRPTDIERFAMLQGIELRTTNLLGLIFDRPASLYVADHFTLVGVPKYTGTNNLEFGVKFGEWSSTGIRLYGSYFSGLEMFSEYYNVRTNHWAIGFAFDFW